jgi:ABC-2 type transport system permease protein
VNRYWRVYRSFFTSSFAREMEFRVNFLAKIAQNGLWVGFFILILLVIFSNTKSVAGWSRADAVVLAGTVFLMGAVAQAFFFSLTEIPEQVRRGTLDYVVTRPIDTQFWVSTRRFNFDQLGSIFAGVVMIFAGVLMSHIHPAPIAWFGYAGLVLCSILIFYSFNLALMTTGIWLVRVDNLWVLSDSVSTVARFPIDIYSARLQVFLTYLVPLAFLSTVPARQLVRGFDGQSVVIGFVWAIFSLVLSRAFWRFALRYYGSASS